MFDLKRVVLESTKKATLFKMAITLALPGLWANLGLLIEVVIALKWSSKLKHTF